MSQSTSVAYRRRFSSDPQSDEFLAQIDSFLSCRDPGRFADVAWQVTA